MPNLMFTLNVERSRPVVGNMIVNVTTNKYFYTYFEVRYFFRQAAIKLRSILHV
jgi:hypothetical protein